MAYTGNPWPLTPPNRPFPDMLAEAERAGKNLMIRMPLPDAQNMALSLACYGSVQSLANGGGLPAEYTARSKPNMDISRTL